MDKEALARLALDAVDDGAARLVLADALLETGWWDERLTSPGFTYQVSPTALPAHTRFFKDADRGFWSKGKMTSARAKAVASALLFGDWPTAWPLAQRARLPWSGQALRIYHDFQEQVYRRVYGATFNGE